MFGDLRLLSILSMIVPFAAAFAADSASGPPRVKADPVEEMMHGQKISDPYRWLEKSDSPETQAYVREQLAYTRSLLDPLPGRDTTQKRLLEMASIGSIGTPQIAGDYYFYSRREGKQNQPLLLVRTGAKGKDHTLIDPNTMSSDSTVALDWWYPSEDGKFVAYGTSPNGSENSKLKIIETASNKLLSDTMIAHDLPALRGRKTIPDSSIAVIPRKAKFRKGKRSTTPRFSTTC
jgi:protease II